MHRLEITRCRLELRPRSTPKWAELVQVKVITPPCTRMRGLSVSRRYNPVVHQKQEHLAMEWCKLGLQTQIVLDLKTWKGSVIWACNPDLHLSAKKRRNSGLWTWFAPKYKNWLKRPKKGLEPLNQESRVLNHTWDLEKNA